MAITQQSYIDNNSKVIAARKKLSTAKSDLEALQRAQSQAGGGKALSKDIAGRIEQANKLVETAQTEVSNIETKARNYFDKNAETILAKAKGKAESKKAFNITGAEEQLNKMKAAGIPTGNLEEQIAAAKEKKVTGFDYVPPAGGVIGSQPGTGTQVEDFAATLAGSRAELKKATSQQLIDLGKKLNAAGIVAPEVG